jgi:hypothetical protein
MALILAVDPEQRQQAALACLARELDEHELLAAASCSDALAALGRRSPDLVLLPLLLPEAEEGELLSQLRAHAGGSEVRALSIPLLKLPDAAPPPPSAHPAWLDQILHPKDASDGAAEECEPAVFADLIRGYLESARSAAADALAAAAELAKAAAEERRARLVAAAHAMATWVRARRDIWNAEPKRVVARPPVQPPVVQPDAWTPSVAVAPPVSSPVASPMFRFDTAAAPTPITEFLDDPDIEFGSNDFLSVEPDVEEPAGPGLAERAAGLAARLGELQTLGPHVRRWLPRAAVAAVVLTLGVSGRSYWMKTAAAPKVGVAVLESLPSGAQVLVDGQPMGLTPLTTTLPAGTHRVDFKYRGKTRTMDVVVTQGGRAKELIDWAPKTTGRLQVNSEPAGARVLIDNVARGVTPLKLDDLALGPHTVVLESGTGSVRRNVTIKADENLTVSETIYAGWLKVFAPFDLTITEGTRSLRLDDRYQVMLSPGPHELRFENRALGYQETRRVEVQPGITTPLSIVAPRSTLTLTTSAPAEVLIDGVSVGRTPLTGFPVDLGTRDVQLKSAAGDRRFSMPVTVKPVVLEIDLSKP